MTQAENKAEVHFCLCKSIFATLAIKGIIAEDDMHTLLRAAAEKYQETKNAPGGLVAALRGHLMCVVPWRTRPAFYSIAIRFGFSGKAFVC